MNSLFSTSVKSGLIALGLISGLTAPSAAGPMFQPDLSIPASTAAPTITPVRDSWAGGNDRQLNNDWRWRRSGNWNRGNWNGGNWDRGDNWRWRHSGRHYRGRYDDGAGAAAILGLGLGLGLGSVYGNNYNYYEPAPRRYYRTYRTQRVSSAHVQWCYNRYRSYRAFDNTFQPYNGPRQQCWSPYS
ncbi:BA14K family protein [Mesorhizobium sp. INR15]|uniref:BA14K family protein n=1 Tax=Mesorhizobium sp. INR15 TaxID=2654248 RepID=UPI001896639F|nr:BA14K family protein [Mesorhizobium sp. INR15]QPC92350.1 BA14K family protein [Mesorhizobium sp. INR15]